MDYFMVVIEPDWIFEIEIVFEFQDDCRDFLKKLKSVAKSELSKVHVD